MSLVHYIYILGLFPLTVYLIFKKQLMQEVRYLEPWLWLVAIGSIYEWVITETLRFDSSFWFMTYTLLGFAAIFYFFYQLLNKQYKKLLLFHAAFFGLFFVGALLSGKMYNDNKLLSYLLLIQTVFIINFSIIWFKDIFSTLQTTPLWNSPSFYFISSLVLYYSGIVSLFLLFDSILKNNPKYLDVYWMVNIMLSLVYRVMLIVGVWKGRNKSVVLPL